MNYHIVLLTDWSVANKMLHRSCSHFKAASLFIIKISAWSWTEHRAP